jgi:hypothetical protein
MGREFHAFGQFALFVQPVAERVHRREPRIAGHRLHAAFAKVDDKA